MTDEEQITALIKNWAAAVHSGDLTAVLADHSPDIVMFDVPPPERGVRGIDEYRETWPPFFQWQTSGAVFEVVSIEVTAGTDVAFAVVLLRCGTADEFERDPEARLRLTVGLRKIDDRWQVTHEHHSFTDKSAVPETSEAEIRSLHQGWFDGTAPGDLAVAWGLDRIVADGKESLSRGTRIFQKRDGKWFMIHQHVSFPLEED